MNTPHLSRLASVILSCILVAIAGLAIWGWGYLSEGGRNSGNTSPSGTDAARLRADYTTPPTPSGVDLIAVPRETFPTGAFAELNSTRYDNILVEVKPDGALRVLGEPMDVPALRSLLVDQMREQLQTVVTIRPHEDCQFRFVRPVISLCEEAGIPHHMQPVFTGAPAGKRPPSSTTRAGGRPGSS